MTVKDEDILQKEALKPSVKSSERFFSNPNAPNISSYSYLQNNRACTAPVFWRIFHYARSYSGYARAEALVPQRELQRIVFKFSIF